MERVVKIIKSLILTAILTATSAAFARGGDDVGNGGFAYRQSVIILKMATTALEEKIRESTMKELVENPSWRVILQDTLGYEDLDKLSKKNQYRGGRKLAMNYIVNPATVIVLKPYFEAFAGKTDTELEDASLEVQKRLVHEAAHIWGYKEEEAEKFAVAFMRHVNTPPPAPVDPRPTNDISIKNNFCSCINGKSDIINDCDSFCARMPITNSPILYVDTLIGQETANHPELGNLYNWCTVQLSGNDVTPQCMLNATDGMNTIDIPVNINPKSNSFTANISQLKKDRTYLLKLVESKTGSSAQTKEFQLRRKIQKFPGEELGALKITPVNQFTCLSFGGYTNPNGEIIRTNYVRSFYYHSFNETPSPLPPVHGGQATFICHDEQMYPGNDSVEFPRLENVDGHFSAWDKQDPRFMRGSNGKMSINAYIENRLLNEYDIEGANLDLFRLVSSKTPTLKNSSLGYMMLPFTDSNTHKTTCPTEVDYNSGNPLMSILGDLMSNTEGIYLAEKEGEILGTGPQTTTVYGTMLVRETFLKDYGFYLRDGMKYRATPNDFHNRTIFYYWPASQNVDPLVQGNRKLFTVKLADRLNGSVPEGIPTDIYTTDKRLGCIPKL